jgi:sec-independent protein translocase protein TatB
MIDLGLTKMGLIGVVALIVIGPEKLPRVARMAGTLFGRAQRYINEVKSEVSREIELEELRRMQKDVQDAAQEVGQTISQGVNEVHSELNNAWQDDHLPRHDTIYGGEAQLARKAKDFRRKKLARTSALPAWYKQRSGVRSQVLSGAARVARHRPGSGKSRSFF